MDSFELNKIIGAILGTLLFVMGVGFLAEAIYAPKATGPGYELPEPELVAGGEEPEEAVKLDIGTLLASANIQQGEATARKCTSCHNFAQGAGNKQGPELYDVVGREIASHEGFTYSEVLTSMRPQDWNYDNLDHFLLAPTDFAPKTKMNFGGLKDDQERANVIAYLASISPDAPAFPAPAAPAADAEVPAEAPAMDATAIETPTTTSTETVVEGTPAPSAPAPAMEAPATTAPTQAPVTSPAPASDAPAAPAQ